MSDIANMSQRSFARLHNEGLRTITDYIFETQPYETMSGLAMAAGLGTQTVYNLRSRKTKFPRFQTIHKLCMASGVTVIVNKSGKISCDTQVITKTRLKLAKVG